VVRDAAAGAYGLFGLVKSHPMYTDALNRVQTDPRAQQLLGTPMEAGALFNGKISDSGAIGSAEISIPVPGPKGSGTVYVTALKREGERKVTRLVLVMDKPGERVVIVGAD
jgi:hypothetical protein